MQAGSLNFKSSNAARNKVARFSSVRGEASGSDEYAFDEACTFTFRFHADGINFGYILSDYDNSSDGIAMEYLSPGILRFSVSTADGERQIETDVAVPQGVVTVSGQKPTNITPSNFKIFVNGSQVATSVTANTGVSTDMGSGRAYVVASRKGTTGAQVSVVYAAAVHPAELTPAQISMLHATNVNQWADTLSPSECWVFNTSLQRFNIPDRKGNYDLEILDGASDTTPLSYDISTVDVIEKVLSESILDADADNFTESGGNVTTAPDSGPSGNDLTVNGTLPYNNSDASFGYHATVTGGSGYLSRAAFVGGKEAQVSIYAVCSWPASGNKVLVDGSDVNDRITMRENSSVAGIFNGLTTLNASSRPDTSDKCLFRADFNDSRLRLLVERSGKSSISASVNIGTDRGSSGVYILSNFLGGAFWDSVFSRAILLPRALTDYEDTAVRGNLKLQYGVSPSP